MPSAASFDGTVPEVGLTYLSMDTYSGALQVPNASVLVQLQHAASTMPGHTRRGVRGGDQMEPGAWQLLLHRDRCRCWRSPTRPELVLGSVSLFHIDADQECAAIGFGVYAGPPSPSVGGRGVQAATTFAFGELALRRVVLFHAVDNPGSCGVAGRTGYVLEGVHRRAHRYGDGRWHDEHSHARLRAP